MPRDVKRVRLNNEAKKKDGKKKKECQLRVTGPRETGRRQAGG